MSLYSQDDYAQSLHSLLPNGRAWPREKGSVQYAVLKALGRAFARCFRNGKVRWDYLMTALSAK